MTGRIKRVLKLLLVDSVVNIVGDMLEQPRIMWVFLAWGWLAVLVMVCSLVADILA